MGYAKGTEWQGFYTDVLDREYYSISVTKKLMILQILCDDVMESAELRAEVDMRGSLADGIDINGSANPLPPLNGPTRVHPKYSKTSACKDMEAINVKPCNSNATQGTNFGSKVTELDTGTTDVDQDANSDECQLCGMDGILLCCDGCPSAYHARCIGLNKMLIPDGLWYCTECTAKKIEPTVRISAGLRGAEIFGIDPYEQIFLGICNHLLVLNVSTDAGPPCRYYKETDIPKVFQVLCSTEQHKTLYSGICKSIMQYWEMLECPNLSLSERTEAENNTTTDTNEDTKASVQIYPPDKLINAVEGENCISSVTVSNMENGMLSDRENDCQEVPLKSTSLETVNQNIQPVLHRDEDSSAPKILPLADAKSCEKFGTESLVSSGSINHCPDHSDLTQQSCVERSTGLDFSTCANGDIDKKVIDSILLPTKNDSLSMSCEKVEGKSNGDGTCDRDKSDGSLYLGDFKPQSYINQYFLGDIAASAAANFAVLASEEKGVTEAHTSSNPRKIVSANIALQLKAFSLASIPFIWPNSDKKATEVPRERCGWCLSCKALTTSRKGCFLNLAASNAIKGSARNTVGLRSIKNGDGIIPGIATYIIWIAESLRGLLVGPFLSSSYRKRWQKEVEKASSCSALKISLLELEEQIRLVAFSGDWVKLVDDWMVESSAVQNTTTSSGAPPKRPGGRRTRKQTAISEVAKGPGDDDLRIVRWWRGGKLSKTVFQKGILPCSIIKKAARQGGRIKISGIYYAEGSEIPKRSRRFAWRAAVELSKNAPQLALQVRYLDLHLRWSDMVRPEQISNDGKGIDAETSAYRNAYICDKKIEENKISYGLVFNQKHLPSRVLKNTIDVDQNEEEEKRFWFFETHVPLYLIKDYEQKVKKDPSPPAKTSHVLSKLQRKQLKVSRRHIFSYLVLKKEKVDKCPCASCQEDLLLGDAVKCYECEGYCHKACTSNSTVVVKDAMDSVTICNQCAKAISSLNENIYKTPVSQLIRQGHSEKIVVAATKDSQINGDFQPLGSVGNAATPSLTKPTIPGRNSASRSKRGGALPSYGIIWKKKYSDEIGTDFRLRNVLLKANGDIDPSKRPTCNLCFKPYNPDLMYICCEECRCWYHADAMLLNESQLFDVLGFKCCKCRRSRSPICPYTDPESRKSRVSADPESRKQRVRTSKQGNIVVEPGFETISKPLTTTTSRVEPVSELKELERFMEEEEEDPLLFSLERVEPVSEFPSELGGAEWDTAGASFQGPQKLPVRRHVKVENEPVKEKLTIRRPSNENNVVKDEMFELEDMDFDFPQNASPPQAEWDIPNDGGMTAEWGFPLESIKDEMFDYEAVNMEDMEFEPQTYFSYTELLATDDNNQPSLFDGSTNMSGGDWNNSADCVAAEVESAVNVSCRMCSSTKPAPDLSCDICGMQIHNQCSPWVESTWGDRWRCGNCRDWA